MPCCGCCCRKNLGECCGPPAGERVCCKPPDECCGEGETQVCCEIPDICCGTGESAVCCPPERDCCAVYTIGEGESEVCCAESEYCCFSEQFPGQGICCEDTEVCCLSETGSSCCEPGQYCCDGVCSDTPCCSGACDDENPCDEGCYCCDGACQAEPCEECTVNGDCADDECCVNGECVPQCGLPGSLDCSFESVPVSGNLEDCDAGPWTWVPIEPTTCDSGCDCDASAAYLNITDPPNACGFGPSAKCCPSSDAPP